MHRIAALRTLSATSHLADPVHSRDNDEASSNILALFRLLSQSSLVYIERTTSKLVFAALQNGWTRSIIRALLSALLEALDEIIRTNSLAMKGDPPRSL